MTESGIALVTGGSSGIGRACAEALAQAGCVVFEMSRRPFDPSVGITHLGVDITEESQVRAAVEEIVAQYPEILQMHGFYIDETEKRVMFDLVIDFTADASRICGEVAQKAEPLRPGWRFDIVLDSDVSD